MYALYGFCRAVDDIADAPAPIADKRAEIAAWARELDQVFAGRGDHALSRELAHAVRAYDFPRDELDLVLEGMTIDAAPRVRIADRTALAHYARRVAGAVGVLSCRIFGAPDDETREFAIYLGETLQLTNILRDVDEDAAIDRLYLPLDRIAAAGIPTDAAAADIVADPRLEIVCASLAREVEERYRLLPSLVPGASRARLRSAFLMQEGYERVFRKLAARGWVRRGARPRLSRSEALSALVAAYRR
jgi:phytoene synthase